MDLIAEEKVLKGILTPQIRMEAIGREVASTGEEEEDAEEEEEGGGGEGGGRGGPGN